MYDSFRQELEEMERDDFNDLSVATRIAKVDKFVAAITSIQTETITELGKIKQAGTQKINQMGEEVARLNNYLNLLYHSFTLDAAYLIPKVQEKINKLALAVEKVQDEPETKVKALLGEIDVGDHLKARGVEFKFTAETDMALRAVGLLR